jgi:hypothetical protein
MKPRDYVLEQIQHHATSPIPFTLDFEGGLDAYDNGSERRDRSPVCLRPEGVVEGIPQSDKGLGESARQISLDVPSLRIV